MGAVPRGSVSLSAGRLITQNQVRGLHILSIGGF